MSAPVRRLGRVLLSVALGVTGLGATVALAAPAEAVGTASISGTLTAGGADDLVSPLITVRKQNPDGSWGSFVSQFWPEGQTVNYSYTGLDAGTYRVEFYDYENYASEYWNGKYHPDQADLITLADGEARTGVNATLEYAASLDGRMTEPDGDPVPDFVGVRAWIKSPVTNDWSVALDNATQGGNGEWEFPQLQPGTYKLEFHSGAGFPELAKEYWNDKSTFAAADEIVLAPGGSFTANAQLAEPPPPTGIAGTITDEDDDPIVGQCATAYVQNGPNYDYANAACTDSNGDYLIEVGAGTYKVEFNYTEDFVSEWYNNAADQATATPIAVPAAGVTGVDAELATAGHISGTVVDEATDAPLQGAYVVASMGSRYGNALTDENGDYEIHGLAAGSYTMTFDPTDSNPGYAFEYYDDVFHEDDADPVPVTSGATATVDEDLAAFGTISGTVTDSTGGADSVLAEVYELVDGTWQTFHSDYTNASGAYEIEDLHPGTYRLKFDGDFAGYESEFWNDVATLELADDIVLEAGGSETANAELDEDGGGGGGDGSIAGTVTEQSAGTPALEDICVRAWYYSDLEDDWTFDESSCTNASGAYEIADLPDDDYRLQFVAEDGDHLTEWWDDQPSLGEADDVAVTGGGAVTGKNAVLAPAGHITGRVTGGGNGLEDVYVQAYEFDGDDWLPVEEAFTEPDGDYDIGGLATGTYRLEVEGTDQFIGEFYDNAATVETATDIPVTAGATTSGRDVDLAPGGTITGAVTGPTGDPIGAGVSAYRLEGGEYEFFAFATNDMDGFQLTGLPSGTYKLEYASLGYTTEWWQNVLTEAAATPIPVTAGATVSGKDAQLSVAAKISGRVTSNGTTPITGASVVAYQRVGTNWIFVRSASTDGSGDFEITNLQPGTYTLAYSASGYLPEYWDDEAAIETAESFAVAESAVVGGKDAVLSPAGHITGTVTSNGTTGIQGLYVYAYRSVAGDWVFADYATTNASGDYDLDSLPTGTYRVEFERSLQYAGEWWNDKATLLTADDVAVTAGVTTPDIDAQLELGGHLTGKVTSNGTTGIEYVGVDAYRLINGTYEYQASTETLANGTYDLPGLAAGTYKVYFGTGVTDDEWAPEWWNDKATLGTADPVVLGAGGLTVPDINATLVPGADLHGVVTGPSGPLASIAVTAYRLVDGDYEFESYDYTSSSGAYEIDSLPAGTYKIGFYDEDEVLAEEFFDNSATLAGATAIPLAASSSGGPFNAQLAASTTPVVTPGTVTVTGTPQVGQTLTASTGTWTPSDVSFAYEWLANDVVIPGAVSATYVPVAGDVGKTIKVRVTGSKSGFTSATTTSTGVGPVAAAPAGTPAVANTALPAVSGQAKVGQTLSASGGSWNPADVSLTYQWLRAGAPIAGATAAAYDVQVADLGTQLSVRVSAAKAGFTGATATSAPTGAVGKGTITVSKKPKLTGKAKVFMTLGVKKGTYVPAGAKVKYQWLSNGNKINGEKDDSFDVKLKHLGRTISVKVTISAPGYQTLVIETKGKKIT